MSALLDLAARCEAATGPDRALDYRIFCECVPIGERAYWEADNRENHFTASIEAAMSLVDPRALWAIGSMEEGPFCRLCWPQPNGGFTGGYFEGQAETVPLSICVAALRARSEAAAERGRKARVPRRIRPRPPHGKRYLEGSVSGSDRNGENAEGG